MTEQEEIQFVTFEIASAQFGLSVFDVERVLRYEKPAALPKAPAFLEGMMPYGEHSIPVIDLRRRFEAAAAINDETRTLILRWDQGLVGFVVDTVTALRTVAVRDIQTPPAMVRGLAAEYVSGIVHSDGKTLVLLSASTLLTSKERIALEPLRTGSS